MSRRPQCRRSGFTLIESLIVVALIGILALMGFPALQNALSRAKLTGTASSILSFMQFARLEAIKVGGSTARVEVDFNTNSLLAYTDRDNSGTYTAPDTLIGRMPLPNGVSLHGPGVMSTANLNAVWNFDALPSGGAVVIFKGDGSVSKFGAIRLRDQKGNILEVRVQPQATARVFIQKFTLDPDGSDDPTSTTAWITQEQGWQWN